MKKFVLFGCIAFFLTLAFYILPIFMVGIEYVYLPLMILLAIVGGVGWLFIP